MKHLLMIVGKYRYMTKLAHDTGKKMLLPVHSGHDNSHFVPEPYVMPETKKWQ